MATRESHYHHHASSLRGGLPSPSHRQTVLLGREIQAPSDWPRKSLELAPPTLVPPREETIMERQSSASSSQQSIAFQRQQLEDAEDPLSPRQSLPGAFRVGRGPEDDEDSTMWPSSYQEEQLNIRCVDPTVDAHVELAEDSSSGTTATSDQGNLYTCIQQNFCVALACVFIVLAVLIPVIVIFVAQKDTTVGSSNVVPTTPPTLSPTVQPTLAGAWVQLGQDIHGEASYDLSGWPVSLSSDGRTVAVGAAKNDGNGPDAGHVRIFHLEEEDNQWIQVGKDIDGEAAGDAFGIIISISANGTIVAIGGYQNDGGGSNAGHARVYELDGDDWIQVGNDLDGKAAGDEFGCSISLSADGTTVAIGGRMNNGSAGHVQIYHLEGSRWNQVGSDIDGEAAGDMFGTSVSLSSDGRTVAIGSTGNDDNGSDSGHVRVYQFAEGSDWTQLGQDIDGEAAHNKFGRYVSLSFDGRTVAIGAPFNDDSGTWSGHVRVYQFAGGNWTQLGQDIDGEAEYDYSGWSVSLSSDGRTVAIGAHLNDENGEDSGHVRIYRWEEEKWKKVGNDIDGEAAYDNFGYSMSLSADGTTVAIGACYNDGHGTDSGHVRVYQLLA